MIYIETVLWMVTFMLPCHQRVAIANEGVCQKRSEIATFRLAGVDLSNEGWCPLVCYSASFLFERNLLLNVGCVNANRSFGSRWCKQRDQSIISLAKQTGCNPSTYIHTCIPHFSMLNQDTIATTRWAICFCRGVSVTLAKSKLYSLWVQISYTLCIINTR